ncbi:MAG: LysR family transcriptional regulator [Bradymonadia bacterium]
MDRTLRLMNLWNWLPAFRVVAQTEHLPTASERLNVSASALSRTIRLLEDEVGRPLFDRVGRRLVLNADGRALLMGIRDAMRRVDDALNVISADVYRGPLRVSAPGAFTALMVLPAIDALVTAHPAIVPHLLHEGPQRANEKLLDGRLDLALLDDPIFDEQLQAERLSALSYGVFCGPEHPLYTAEVTDLETLCPYPFVAPPEGADDHWPEHLPRKISLAVSSLQMGAQVCARGHHLAVLPTMVARPPLKCLCSVPQETALYVVRRIPLGVHGVVDEALKYIVERVAELNAQSLL